MSHEIGKIGIIGAGAWGTALAAQAAEAGREVVLWAREPEVADGINTSHTNAAFLPGIALDPKIVASTDLAEAAAADAVALVMPAQFLRPVGSALSAHLAPGVPAVICCKGIEQGSALLMSEIASEILLETPLAVLSGPTFAAEVARGLPTAVTLATEVPGLAERLARAIGSDVFRVYTARDMIGAEIGGAVKNVLAIACGIVAGKRLGDNARAALITRGLSEIVRIATAKGAEAETLMGLSGLGDLTLTCNAMQSRNFSLGVALGEGRALADVLGERRTVSEGVASAASVVALARRIGVEAPITAAVDTILNHGADIDTVIADLLARPTGIEDPFGDGP